jgi:hypothetical protein
MPREVTDEMIQRAQAAYAATGEQGRKTAVLSHATRWRFAIAEVLALLDAEDVPVENDDPTKINLIGRTSERRKITVDRDEYKWAKENDSVDLLLDAWLSKMDGETWVVEPDGTVVHPYA